MELVALLVGIFLIVFGVLNWPDTLAVLGVIFGVVLVVYGVPGTPWRRR